MDSRSLGACSSSEFCLWVQVLARLGDSYAVSHEFVYSAQLCPALLCQGLPCPRLPYPARGPGPGTPDPMPGPGAPTLGPRTSGAFQCTTPLRASSHWKAIFDARHRFGHPRIVNIRMRDTANGILAYECNTKFHPATPSGPARPARTFGRTGPRPPRWFYKPYSQSVSQSVVRLQE